MGFQINTVHEEGSSRLFIMRLQTFTDREDPLKASKEEKAVDGAFPQQYF